MPCLSLPVTTPPSLPLPLTLGPPPAPPLPDVPDTICCKLPIKAKVPPIPTVPGAVIGPLASAIAAYLKTIHDYLDGLALECPRE